MSAPAPTTLDDFIDRLVDGVRVVLQDGLNDRFSPVQVVASTTGMPATLGDMSALKLPAICVWRQRTQNVVGGARRTDEQHTLRIDYIAPATQWSMLEKRWRMLDPIHRACVELLYGGAWTRDPVPGRLWLRETAGLITVRLLSATAVYDQAEGAAGVFPAFLSTIEVVTRPEVIDESVPLRELYARLFDPGGNPASQPMVTAVGRTPFGELGDDLSDDPADPDADGDEEE